VPSGDVRGGLAQLACLSIANGDLTQKIVLNQHDEVGKLAAAMNLMVEKVREIAGEVQSATTKPCRAKK
jgi:methyl-accepting chemotaxis protein